MPIYIYIYSGFMKLRRNCSSRLWFVDYYIYIYTHSGFMKLRRNCSSRIWFVDYFFCFLLFVQRLICQWINFNEDFWLDDLNQMPKTNTHFTKLHRNRSSRLWFVDYFLFSFICSVTYLPIDISQFTCKVFF